MKWAFLLVALVVGAGCISGDRGDARGEQPPGRDCEGAAPSGVAARPGTSVSNQPGAFTYSGQVAAGQGKEEWAWQNPTPSALVSWGGQGAAGTFRLTLLDACGDRAYQKSFSTGQQASSEETLAGEPGAWLVRVELTGFTGQFSLSVTQR